MEISTFTFSGAAGFAFVSRERMPAEKHLIGLFFGGHRATPRMEWRQPLFECGTAARTNQNQTDENDDGDRGMTFDRRRTEL
jgi:hypothetical protein